MEPIVIHAVTLESAQGLCAALAAFDARVVEGEDARHQVEVPVSGMWKILSVVGSPRRGGRVWLSWVRGKFVTTKAGVYAADRRLPPKHGWRRGSRRLAARVKLVNTGAPGSSCAGRPGGFVPLRPDTARHA